LKTPAIGHGVSALRVIGPGGEISVNDYGRPKRRPAVGFEVIETAIARRGRALHKRIRRAYGDERIVLGAPLMQRARGNSPAPEACQQATKADRTRGLAQDGDAIGVAAEPGNVVPDPAERGDLVEQAAVPARRIVPAPEPTLRSRNPNAPSR
jgi:hypothetical protein